MPKVIRVTLPPEQRAEINERARIRTLAPRLRDRLEMVRLSDLGQTIPQIARQLGVHEQIVRKYLKAFLDSGFVALPDHPVPGRPPTVTPAAVAALGHLLDEAAAQGHTWTTSSCLVRLSPTSHSRQCRAGAQRPKGALGNC